MTSLDTLWNNIVSLLVMSSFTKHILTIILPQLCRKAILVQPGVELYLDVVNSASPMLMFARYSGVCVGALF